MMILPRALAFLLLLLVLLGGPTRPASAHLSVQLIQGANANERARVVALPGGFHPDWFDRMPNGLYRNPPKMQVEIELLSGAHRGRRVMVEHFVFGNPTIDVVPRIGERVLVTEVHLTSGQDVYQITDYDRSAALAGASLAVALLVLVLGGAYGWRTLLLAGGGLGLLFAVLLPSIIRGQLPPPLLAGLGTLAIGVAATRSLVSRGRPESYAALAGCLAGVVAAGLATGLSFNMAHVTGLSTADAIQLYTMLNGARNLDYSQIWLAGDLVTTLGGILVVSVLTARAIARCPEASAWRTGVQEARSLLPLTALMTGCLYFGVMLPLLLIYHAGGAAELRVSFLRFWSFEYLVAVILAWEGGLIGCLAAGFATAGVAAWMRRRLAKRHAH